MSLTLKTTLGDIKVELYCQQVPKACKNFLALAASGYYNDTTFHRNMKGFMVQGGDPTGTGKGGKSIWGGLFEDEFVSTLKHERRGILSMANQGPNTNGKSYSIFYFALLFSIGQCRSTMLRGVKVLRSRRFLLAAI